MNKILKRLVGLFIIGIGILNICNATNVNSLITTAYSGEVTLGANTTTNAIDLGSAPNKTLCITLYGNLGNNNYVNIGFYGNTTSVASDSQEYWYDQVGKTVCMYANKRYFNINNPKATTPTIRYETFFLNDLLNTEQTCNLKFIDQNNFVRNYYSSGLFYVYFNTNYNTFTHSPNPYPYILDLTLSNNAILKSDIDANYCESNNLCNSNTGNKVNVWLLKPGENVLEESIVFTGDYIYLRSSAGATYNYFYNNSNNLGVNFSYDSVSCDTGEILSGYILESSINTAYCTGNNLCPQCEECQQCQTCPTIDAQYCMDNFNLIPPAYCPICGTGDINRSSLYINGIQYNGNEIIDIHTEDQMQTNIDYLNDTADIDITYGQDEEYLNTILSGTAMTPTKEDFSTMLSDGLIAYAPYLFIGLLMIFTIGLIKKFFRG